MNLDTSNNLDNTIFQPETIFSECDGQWQKQLSNIIDDKKDDYESTALKEQLDNANTTVDINKDSDTTVVLEFERWEGRVVDINDDLIRARIENTQGRYPNQYVEIKKDIFRRYKIKSEIQYGDCFEIRIDETRIGKQIIYKEKLRMINTDMGFSPDEFSSKLKEELRQLSIDL